MPTLPLYSLPENADDSHAVRAPGGYEWWYFDAEDLASDTRVVVILLDGFVFHPRYLRDYARYRRWPTRVAPPTPRDFPCAYVAVYRAGKVLAQVMSQYTPGSFSAASGPAGYGISIGENAVGFREGRYDVRFDGAPWSLTWQGPKRSAGGRLAGALSFAPAFGHSPHERTFLSRAMTGAEHKWVIAAPLCTVNGSVRLKPSAGEAEQVISFSGTGYHDHNYGTAPLGQGLRRWTWGRLLGEGRATIFHVAEPTSPGTLAETHLVTADADGVREVRGGPWEVVGSCRSAVGLSCPRVIRCGTELALSNPRIIDASPFYLRAVYDARTPTGGGTALCETAYPGRLRWPVLGRMIELSIDHVD